ncbi:hypothetical protein PHLGIDRAFT_348358 [Phlebiopsis gigantea 11061_1 CR5-6]|uniref:Uncharacterized protein n=1 Tax=Phlebiopsis gigantea (strain 11061_1 CR5-6) TaxID=745531 RepID=A0A0C3NUY3_PHLG1|nr:hypothetical protein PHLGIDRAFT_348358 [Phlebiopsis gigantea 11061_1 CR5-6]
MSKPITLFRPRRLVTSDDGGTTIVKYSLPQPVPAPYDASQLDGTQRTFLVYIPSLQSICLKKLSEYPNQLHVLEATRIQYKPPEDDRDHDLLREVIPTYCHENAEQLSEEFLKTVDPRLWATLIQIYTDLPDSLRTYQLPLSDAHMPVLQDIPSTRHFSLITILELRSCPELNDSTVVELGQLHGLTALDLGATALTSHGLKALAKTLVKNSAHSRVLSGPWGLRMLSLRNCMKISDDALENLARFPLLSAVDLRGTCCTPTAYRKTLFSPSADETLYHPTPLRDALSALAHKSSTIYSHPEPFFIHIDKLAHQPTMPPPIRRPGPVRPRLDHPGFLQTS